MLDQPEMAGRRILLAGDNFGCGSSREHAPWALVAWGVRAVITTRCADIFRGNALKNGLLPIVVDPSALASSSSSSQRDPDVELTRRPRVPGRPPARRRGPAVRRRPVLEADAPRGDRRARLPARQGGRDRCLGTRAYTRAPRRHAARGRVEPSHPAEPPGRTRRLAAMNTPTASIASLDRGPRRPPHDRCLRRRRCAGRLVLTAARQSVTIRADRSHRAAVARPAIRGRASAARSIPHPSIRDRPGEARHPETRPAQPSPASRGDARADGRRPAGHRQGHLVERHRALQRSRLGQGRALRHRIAITLIEGSGDRTRSASRSRSKSDDRRPRRARAGRYTISRLAATPDSGDRHRPL